MSVLGRIGNVFVSPEKCFTSIRDEGTKWTDFVIPILLLIATVIAFMMITGDIMADVQKDAIMKMEQYSQEQKEMIIQQSGSPVAKIISTITAALGAIVTALLGALFMMIVGNFIGGGEQKYGTLLATALYVLLISIPESIIKIFLVLQKETIGVYLGFASLIQNPDPTSFGFNLLAQFEFFKIWRIIVWVVAFKVLYKYTGKKATLLVVITMLLGMIVSAAWSTFQMGRMG